MRHLIHPLVLLLILLATPSLPSARIYIWTDAEGVKHYSQEPPPEDATEVMEKDEVHYDASADAKSHRAGSATAAGAQRGAGDGQTRIVMEGNILQVPVTLVYAGKEVATMLVLDTGASSTVLTVPLAERLGVEPEINTQVKVAGGTMLDAQSVTLDSLSVGPHTRRNMRVLILRHQGARPKLHGALGLNFLRHYPYSIDMQKMVINWEAGTAASAP
ncbi:MAG: aspartyl protease family protein [Desulfobacterales bacterium]|nr:aspartyl protease family protein [Desulfobacterales bacterium]MDJ0856248.1 aspartyl protease family protein [Desulfobacterales bacterium]MDJ0888903.1 aspartyl protease family protein [Desulfobacterales bacterium]